VGLRGYALHVKDESMHLVFPKNTILIVDPEKPARDRSYVIVKLYSFEDPILDNFCLMFQIVI
jgi:SOS-response transcriptional repressor LexA